MMQDDQLKALVHLVKGNLRFTKVVATRSVKTQRGDFFAGFAAAWDTVQDDQGGMGADTDLVVDTEEVAQSGMTFAEVKVAHNLVAMQADLGAYEAAFANGAISQSQLDDARKAIKNNYAKLIRGALVDAG
jgi:hypothetical protein